MYPPLAAQAQLQGSVELRCQIARDGTVAGVTVGGGSDLLVQAARANVMAWRFEKTNGDTNTDSIVLVNVFRLFGECEKTSCPTQFSFEYPNRATIETQPPRWQP